MRTLLTVLVTAAFLAALAVATGCEDTPRSAGENYTMSAFANPSTVRVNPETPDVTEPTTIVATVLSDLGTPQEGFTVHFTTDGGTLNSNSAGVETNARGEARDVLNVGVESPATINVTAISSTLTATTKVTKTLIGVNNPPVAKIVALPADEQAVARSVSFDASTSTDPDVGDSVASYSWSITSSAPDTGWTNPQTYTTAVVAYPTGFTHAQTLTANLQVTDEHGVASPLVSKTFVIKDRVCSENAKPTARIAGGATLVGAVNGEVSFIADGSASSDPETNLSLYTWSCGGTFPPVVTPPGGDGSQVTCRYTVGTTQQIFTVTLTVTDSGFPPSSTDCRQTSTSASVPVTVKPPS
jgi:hypothetical protein